MIIKIDTNAVRTAAERIAVCNAKIASDFAAVENAVRNLDRNWSGTASNQGINKLAYIKKTFADERYQVLNDLVRLMKVQVGEGYEATEAANVTSASAFK